MKKTLVGLSVGLCFFSSLLGAGQSAGSWWDKGASILESVTKKTNVTTLAEPSVAEIGEAFKQALGIGCGNVVTKLGGMDGFNADPLIHIPLPDQLNTVKNMLAKVGMSKAVDDLELKLNRAAEAATPKAKELFMQSIADMTFEDVNTIYKGPEDSATKYFQEKMTPSLMEEMRPIIEESLSQVGALQAYDNVMGKYKTMPFVPDVKADLSDHVVQKGMDGIFFYIAKEESAIRSDPLKQTTSLLKKVFGHF
nr:DUF4197 domain-containing protein [Desulfobulbaceae bacterium]